MIRIGCLIELRFSMTISSEADINASLPHTFEAWYKVAKKLENRTGTCDLRNISSNSTHLSTSMRGRVLHYGVLK